VPLVATDNPDIQVGGVSSGPAAAQRAAPDHHRRRSAPLRAVDTAAAASRGGCTCHVSHPGGRSYDSPPVNAVAESPRPPIRGEGSPWTRRPVRYPEKQARQSTDVGAPGILDLRRVRTVLH
jgi:uncharacterized protein (DUF2126 family)